MLKTPWMCSKRHSNTKKNKGEKMKYVTKVHDELLNKIVREPNNAFKTFTNERKAMRWIKNQANPRRYKTTTRTFKTTKIIK